MTRPNVVLFTWHDAGDWFGCYGHGSVDTPHVDRLAAQGVRFSEHFSACAICSPSRAAIATGRFCQRSGVMSLTNRATDNRIHPQVPHLARRLKGLGYHSALLGVQHEAAHEHLETVMGFDELWATDPWPQSDLSAAYLRRWLGERAGASQPFYLQIGTYDAHLGRFYTGEPPRPDEPYPPVQDCSRGLAQPGYLVGSEADRRTIATLQGQLQRGDRLMGALLDGLDAAGLTGNSLVCMCVDHGVGLSRAKTTCYEAGNRVAWILRGPGLMAGTTVDALCGHIDVLPTLWELLGEAPLPELDGVSLAAHARGQRQDPVHAAVYSHMVGSTRCIRTQQHLLIRNFQPPRYHGGRADCADQLRGSQPPQPRPAGPRPHLECYDRHADPDCLHDRSGDPAWAGIVAELDARLWDFLLEHDDYALHESVRDDWQAETRAQLEAHCRRRGRRAPLANGPRHNPIDAASARGVVCVG